MSYFFKALQSGTISGGFTSSLPEKIRDHIRTLEFRMQPGEAVAEGEIFGWVILEVPEKNAWSVLKEIIRSVQKQSSLVLKKPCV